MLLILRSGKRVTALISKTRLGPVSRQYLLLYALLFLRVLSVGCRVIRQQKMLLVLLAKQGISLAVFLHVYLSCNAYFRTLSLFLLRIIEY